MEDLEREAIQREPSLCLACELAEAFLLKRSIRGSFSVSATSVRWVGVGNALRTDREALEAFASTARWLGITASRVGFEVVVAGAAKRRAA